MENIMQRTEAAKWFWPFVFVAVVAAAIVIGSSALVQAKGASGEPDFRMKISVIAHRADVSERTAVMLEPSHLVVVAARAPSILDQLAGLLPQRKPRADQSTQYVRCTGPV
jgi:hypothetical protein